MRANPSDDSARLVYADWLIERGDPRGEIIELQIQRPRRRAQLAKLVAKLRRPTWAGQWPPAFERGFATKIVVTDGHALVEHVGEIRRAHPLATLELADRAAVAISSDDQLVATILTEQQGAGNQATGTSWTTTTAVVVDQTGREIWRDSRTYEEWYSGSGDGESGTQFSSLAFSSDGRDLVLRLSDGTTVTHSFA